MVIDELNAVSDDKLRADLIQLTRDFKILQVNQESEALAEIYIKRGIFPEKYREDAIHLALASVNGIDILYMTT